MSAEFSVYMECLMQQTLHIMVFMLFSTEDSRVVV